MPADAGKAARLAGAQHYEADADLTTLHDHPDNPWMGDDAAVGDSIDAVGFYGAVLAQVSTRRILAGHTRRRNLFADGITTGPVLWLDVDDDAARRILLGDNRYGQLGEWNAERLAAMLTSFGDDLSATGFAASDTARWMAAAGDIEGAARRDAEIGAAGQGPAPRTLPLDCIFSWSGTSGPWLAHAAGWLWGSQSGRAVTAMLGASERTADFVDQPWHAYSHSGHLTAVAAAKPRYATVRDLLTQGQADHAGVEFYDLPRTLDMAAEVAAAGAQNLILIPKFDCLDAIPAAVDGARVVLGYSVPTSYGGTPLPPSAFAGRPVHLLGGNWTRQMALLRLLGDDVVSIDHNHSCRIAEFGRVTGPGGKQQHCSEWTGGTPTSMYALILLSLAYIADDLRHIFAADAPTAPDDLPAEMPPEGLDDR